MSDTLISKLIDIVGKDYVITDEAQNHAYTHGYRFGKGKAIATVRPKTLLEQWNVLQECVAADVIIISQASNTGLTGGSTPNGEYDRDVVIISPMRNNDIHLINDNTQVVCLPGSRLNELEEKLKPFNREPHSVIGSSCIGASIIGGVCNNSGGALVSRGPAFTEMSLFAKVNEQGELELVNHLDINLGETPEEILTNLQEQKYTQDDILNTGKKGHRDNYKNHVRQVDEQTPARFNADPQGHFESSGCAGKVAVFAVRLDTFEADESSAVFYIGTNNTATLNKLRRHMLQNFENLPISGEYIHKDAFDIAEIYGKDTFLAIKKLGTHRLPKLFELKNKVDRIASKIPLISNRLSDKSMQLFSNILPNHLPEKMREYRKQYAHHLILKMGGTGVEEAREYLQSFFANDFSGNYFECNAVETQAAMLHRFAVASAAIRYRDVHTKEVEDIVALDIALPRNEENWFEQLPAEIEDKIIHKLYYGHFMCHVFHQDYIVKKGNDVHKLEEEMLKLLDKRGAKYPAEHNVGHLYHAEESLKNHYKNLDPTNSFNPGIGKTTRKKNWEES